MGDAMPPSVITSVLIVAAISLSIGYVVGWLIATLRSDRRHPKEDPADGQKPDASAGQNNLLRLWRENEGSGLSIELRGKKLPTPKDLSLDTRRELVGVLTEVKNWLGIPEQTAMDVDTEANSVRAASGTKPVDAAINTIPPTPEPPRPSIIDGMTTVIADVVSPQTVAKRDVPKSIVEQIDEIFQAKLLGTPYEGQKIYISEDVRKGVIVWIGNVMYEGVGSMPDGEVKELLRASVRDWERIQEQTRRRNEKV